MIMLNPEANGVKYFGDVLRFYDEAKEANGDNPRPVFLSAVFEQNLPEFVRPKRDFCEEVAKAKELFKKQDKTVLKPYWGESFIKMFAGKCDN